MSRAFLMAFGLMFAWVALPVGARGGESETTAPNGAVALYDADPRHPWNRLHAALFLRRSADGGAVGADRVDPLLWDRTDHLLTGPSHGLALRALADFLERGEPTVDDPLRRALLQSDLWAAFDWTAPLYDRDWHPPEKQALRAPLARAIRRLGLDPARIDRLPDNYAEAVSSGAYPTRFDPANPERPFLPDDLFRKQGDWVCIGPGGIDVAAPAHTQFARGRSVFLVFFNTPGGRAATLDYLGRLRDFPRPWRLNPGFHPPDGNPDPIELNPVLPQFPAGTKVALVRQMNVVDDRGNPTPTRLTQSVQLRVYRVIGEERRPRDPEARPARFEFNLSRQALFGGRHGGLRAVEPGETDYMQFMSHPFDPVPKQGPRVEVLANCLGCHGESGIFSLHTYTRAFSPHGTRPPDLGEIDPDFLRLQTIAWKGRQYEWGLLEGMWR